MSIILGMLQLMCDLHLNVMLQLCKGRMVYSVFFTKTN